MRYHIDHPEHRFFLALLMNVQNRRDIETLIAERFPDQSPVETILGWAEELIEPTDLGMTLLDAPFPDSLDIAIEAQAKLFITALKQALTEDLEKQIEHPEIHTALTNSCLRPLFS